MRCTVWKNKIVWLLPLFMLIFFCGCSKNKTETIQFFSMDTIMQMTAYGDHAADALPQARKTVEELDTQFNATNADSVLSKLQDGDVLPENILSVLQTAQMLSRATDGALDITLYPLTNAWGFYTKDYRVPTSEECKKLLQSRGTWSLSENIFHIQEGTKLDLGSVAKGYAGMCAADTLRQNGVTSAILSLGGNVQTVGLKPNGKNWTVAVTDPLNPNSSVCTLSVGEGAVVTSGSYQRNFTENGKTYHHILDPQTGRPVENDLLSVTVFCEDGTIADGLSTALFVMGPEKAEQFCLTSDISFDALFISKDKNITYTKGFASGFELTDETYSTTLFF